MAAQEPNNQDALRRPSIRDVQIDRPQKGEAPNSAAQRRANRPRREGAPRQSRLSVGWWLLAAILLVGVSVISLPIVFSDTTLEVKPVVTKATFEDAVFTAVKKDSEATEAANALLTYDILEWTADATTTLEPSDRKFVEEKASGIITVFNNYTTSKQRLIKNTRFETDDGRVYRVRESIMVPGKTAAGPGTLDVTVYADEAGERYNLSEGSFTLPGLKSIPNMYTDIYAKVKTPINGGFSGERAVVSESQKEETSRELRAELEAQVMSEVAGRLPENARYFEEGIFIDFADTAEREVEGQVAITEVATVRVYTFDKTAFANTIAAGVVGNPSSGDASLKVPEELAVRLDRGAADTETGDVIKLVVNGNADFIWLFDEAALTADLAGKNREALRTILAGYPTIKSAEAIIRPFWRSTFPSNSHDFTIKMLEVE